MTWSTFLLGALRALCFCPRAIEAAIRTRTAMTNVFLMESCPCKSCGLPLLLAEPRIVRRLVAAGGTGFVRRAARILKLLGAFHRSGGFGLGFWLTAPAARPVLF